MRRWLLSGVVAALAALELTVGARPAVAQPGAVEVDEPGASATARIVVVRVPIPAAARAAAAAPGAPLWWRATAGPGVRLLGPDRGRVAAGDSLLRLTLQRAPTVRGGRHLGAVVWLDAGEPEQRAHQSSGGADGLRGAATDAAPVAVIRVPVDVAPRREVRVRAGHPGTGTETGAVVRGHWTTLPLTVANRGNVTERGRLVMALPAGWRITGGAGWDAVTVHPGQEVVRTPRLWVPAGWPAGQQALTVHWQPSASPAPASPDPPQEARLEARLEVQAGRTTAPGPRVELTTMGVRADDGGMAAGGALLLAGPLVGDVTVDARVAVGGTRSPGAAWGLARGGVVTAPPVLSLSAPRGALTLGTVQGTGSLLAGAFLTGVGGAARWEPPRHRLQLYGARPFAFSAGRPWSAGVGQLLGGAIERQGTWGRVGLEGAHLRDPLAGRALDAAVLGGVLTPAALGEVDGAVGWRRYATGQGAGAQVGYRRVGATSAVELRAVHAPGGSAAFARAARELALSASRQLGARTTLAGGAWRQGDEGGVLGRLRSEGWYLMPSVALRGRALLASLELRGASLRSAGSGGTLANDEQQVTALLTAQRGRTTLGVRAGVAMVRRAVGAEALPLVATSGQRAEWRATVGRWLPGGGRLEGSWTAQGGAGDAQVVPRQQGLTARVDRLPLPGLPDIPVTLEGDAQWLASAGAAPVWMARGGVRLPLPAGGALVVQAERVPFVTSGRGGGVVYAVRVEQRAGLPRIGTGRARVAFADVNANGRRDRGEPGVPGVAVRCGGAAAAPTAVSDAAGRVRCPVGDAVEVDPRTLPSGYLAPRRDGRAARQAEPLALRPVRALVVQLVPLEADTFRLKPADLARAVVTARDGGAQQWTARSLGDGRFVFDALSPGTFRLEVELAEIAEPLQLASPLAPVTVTAGDPPPPVVIAVRARPLRLTPPTGAPTSGSTPGRHRTGGGAP